MTQMIRTQVFEAVLKGPGQIEETELGWVNLPEVPIEKKAPQPPKPGEPPVQPLTIKINGQPFFVIGHTWDVKLTPMTHPNGDPTKGPMADSSATLILVVQRVPPMPSGLVRAGAETMEQLKTMMPPPGGNGTH